MRFTITQRIRGSFLILIIIFVTNGLMTIITLNHSKRLSEHISTVIDPMQQYIKELGAVIVESKMYTTNWVFLRSNLEDKKALKQLQDYQYPRIKQRITTLLPALNNRTIADSIKLVFTDFEQLIAVDREVMSTLSQFEDYDDLMKRMYSEQILEDEVIPRTATILTRLNNVFSSAKEIKEQQYQRLENYSSNIRVFIICFSIFMIGLGVFLSVYFAKVITEPLKKIKKIINDLGKGIINKVNYTEREDEIGEMVHSVNNLSEKLEETAKFAQAVGDHNYELAFEPLSKADILGKALLTMRDNIKVSEERLLKTTDNLMKRNQALEQYTFIVSHNLRAPISNIIGLSDLIQTAEMEPADIREMSAGLYESARKLDDVIHDLNYILETKQQVHETPEPISLETIVNDVRITLSNTIEQTNTRFQIDFTEVPHVCAIKPYLVSIFYNMISNSIKYRRPEFELLITIRSYFEAGHIVILFSDNGKGIDMEKNRDKLFRLYERFDLTVEGKGMGLFMIKTQVENLGGTITVDSEVDQGTDFRIVLPDHLAFTC